MSEPVLFLVAGLGMLAAMMVYAAHLSAGQRIAGWLATGLTALSLAALVAGLVVRSLAAGHWPLATSYEFALVWVAAVLAVYLLTERLASFHAGGAFVLPVALLLTVYASAFVPAGSKVPQPLSPALQSTWLHLHVLTAAVAYGACAVAGGVGVMYLVQEAARSQRLPPLAAIDDFNFRVVKLGYPWLTLTIVLGAVWAQVAWGNYWSWDIKETWALITWLVYTLFLHGRVLRGWQGRPLALLTVIGFAAVVFTFLGVGWLARWAGLESLHVY